MKLIKANRHERRANGVRENQIPLRHLVRTSFEADSVMEFGREPAISCYSSLLAS